MFSLLACVFILEPATISNFNNVVQLMVCLQTQKEVMDNVSLSLVF